MSIDNSNLGKEDQQREHAGTIAARIEGTQALLDSRLDVVAELLNDLVSTMLSFNQREANAYTIDKDALRTNFFSGNFTKMTFEEVCPRYVGEHAMDVSYGGIGQDTNILSAYHRTKVDSKQAIFDGAYFPGQIFGPAKGAKASSLLDFLNASNQPILQKTGRPVVDPNIEETMNAMARELVLVVMAAFVTLGGQVLRASRSHAREIALGMACVFWVIVAVFWAGVETIVRFQRVR